MTMRMGSLERRAVKAKKAEKIESARKLWDDSAAIMSAIVPTNLVRGSSRWIGESRAT